MIIFLVILIFTFSSQASSSEAERGVAIGAKCDEIRKIESGLDSQELTKDKTQMLIGFSGVHQDLEAKMVYTCSENGWQQIIRYGYFSEEEAYKEALSYLTILQKKFGSFTKLIDTMNIFYRVVAWFKDREMYKEFSTYWVQNNNGSELALTIQPVILGSKVDEKKWNVVFTASINPITKCLDSKCENIQLRGLLD